MDLNKIYNKLSEIEKVIMNVGLALNATGEKLNILKIAYKDIRYEKQNLLLIKVNQENYMMFDDIREKIIEAELNIKIMIKEILNINNNFDMERLKSLAGGDNYKNQQ